MEIGKLIEEVHENAVKKGFWEDYTNALPELNNVYISQFLMLLVSEVAEAQEGLRHNDYENFEEELADVAIRLFDLCGGLGIDLENEIEKKMIKNASRPYKHGKTF